MQRARGAAKYRAAVMRSSRRAALLTLAGVLLVSGRARADIPAGYKGKPFDPAVAGGKGVIPPGVKAGPYAVPGRVDLINYDLGGVGVAYDCIHHEVKGGAGYRVDVPTASLSLTAASKMDVWYKAGAPRSRARPTPARPRRTSTSGRSTPRTGSTTPSTFGRRGRTRSSTAWATGNGPPGGQGGDGSMGVQISVNGTMMVDWKASFPDYETKANYHNWKPGPRFRDGDVLEAWPAGRFKIQLTSNHLNLDYLDFALVGGADGGTGNPDAGGASGSVGTTGAAGTNGAAGTSGACARARRGRRERRRGHGRRRRGRKRQRWHIPPPGPPRRRQLGGGRRAHRRRGRGDGRRAHEQRLRARGRALLLPTRGRC